MPHELFVKVIRPKVHGSWNLHVATLDQPLDFFVLLASIAGMVGDTSQSNYAAGSAFQDALAHHRVERGLPATALDLSRIMSVGYVAEKEGAAERNLVRWGFLPIEEDEFLAMVDIAITAQQQQRPHHGTGQIVTGVGTQAHFDRSNLDMPHWFRDPVFSHLRNMRARNVGGAGAGAGVEPPLAHRLRDSGSAADAAATVLDAIARRLSKALMIALEDIDVTNPTARYGVDSLVAVEVRNWLLREAKADIPVFEILQASSLKLLAFKVVEKSLLISDTTL
jgi:hypothetical protein